MNNQNEENENNNSKSNSNLFSQLSYKELIFFKEEIYKSLKEFEKKIEEKLIKSIKDFDERMINNEKIYQKYEKKFNYYATKDEVDEKKLDLKNQIYKKFQDVSEHMTSANIQLSAIRTDLSNACYKYDRIFLENLTIKGFIGDGCKYKNLKEFILQNKEEISRIDKINQKVLIDLKYFKSKIESTVKEFSLQLETLRNSFAEYINIQIDKYDRKNQNVINDLNDKISQCYVKNSSFVEDIKNETNKLINSIDEVKNIKTDLLEIKNNTHKEIEDNLGKLKLIKNDIHIDLENYLEKTKKMDLTVLNEFNEMKKEFKNIKVNITSIGNLLNEININANNNKEIKNEMINNFNNTLNNLKKDLKNDNKNMQLLSKRESNFLRRSSMNMNINEVKQNKVKINTNLNNHIDRRASQIELLFPYSNPKSIKEEKNDDSILKKVTYNINNQSIHIKNTENKNNNVNNEKIKKNDNIDDNINIDKTKIQNNIIVNSNETKMKETNDLTKKLVKQSNETINIDNNNKNVNNKNQTRLSSLNSINKEEIISSKDNKNIVNENTNINSDIIKSNPLININSNIPSNSTHIEVSKDKKKNKDMKIQSQNFSFQSIGNNINKNTNINNNMCLTTNNSIEINESNNKKINKKMTFRNKFENINEKLLIPQNNSNNNQFRLLPFQPLNSFNNKDDKANLNVMHNTQRTQRIRSTKKMKNKLNYNIELVSDDDIIDIPLIQNNNLEIEKNKSNLEKKIIELEYFTKKKFDELVREIKNFIPIHFNSYIKNYIVSEPDLKKYSQNSSIQTDIRSALISAKSLSSKINTDNSISNRKINLKNIINFHKKTHSAK